MNPFDERGAFRLDVDGFRIRHAEILALGGLEARLHDESKLLAGDPPDDFPAAGHWEVAARSDPTARWPLSP